MCLGPVDQFVFLGGPVHGTCMFYSISILIHSAASKSRPVAIIVFTHVVRPSVCPSVRPSVPTFQNVEKLNKFQVKTMFTTGEIVGMVEWIIDDTCLVIYFYWKCFDSLQKSVLIILVL